MHGDDEDEDADAELVGTEESDATCFTTWRTTCSARARVKGLLENKASASCRPGVDGHDDEVVIALLL